MADKPNPIDSLKRGTKSYEQLARRALPILVRQARARQPLFYSDLARELDMKNPRNLTEVLGTIGKALNALALRWHQHIPPIQSLVINKRRHIPGVGFATIAPVAQDWATVTPFERRDEVQRFIAEVSDYPDWPRVLRAFNLQPPPHLPPPPYSPHPPPPSSDSLDPHTTSDPTLDDDIEQALHHPEQAKLRRGESRLHRELKHLVARNPARIGIATQTISEIEFGLYSGDRIDVLFRGRRVWVAVEVKPRTSDDADIHRGLYQCVKYRAVLAVQAPAGIQIRTLLVLGGRLPKKLVAVRNRLGITVKENLMPR